MSDSMEKVTNDFYYVWKTLYPTVSLAEYLKMIFKDIHEASNYKEIREVFNKFLDEQESLSGSIS